MRTRARAFAATLVLLGLAGGLATAAEPAHEDDNWASMSPASPLTVTAVLSRGETIYITGPFDAVGDNPARHIAKWNGRDWVPLGEGLPGAGVLAMHGDDLYVGLGNQVHKWDGQSWSILPGTFDGGITSMAFSGADLYVGGSFSSVDDIVVNSIARWDGESWSALGSGIEPYQDHRYYYNIYNNQVVAAIAVSGSDVYVGGVFRSAGGETVHGLAKWDGTHWAGLGAGIGGSIPFVQAIAVNGAELYVGGFFETIGGIAARNMARWDGTSWSPLGEGVEGVVRSLAVSAGTVFAGESIYTAGVPVGQIVAWDGESWASLENGIDIRDGFYVPETVSSLAVSDSGDLYVGGRFETVSGTVGNGLIRWDGESWSSMERIVDGVNGPVETLVTDGRKLYVGGYFSGAGGKQVNGIASWDGSTWSPLGAGVRGGIYAPVMALAVSGSDVYVGGDFSMAGDVPAKGIAKWDGSAWSTLGSGMQNGHENARVYALAVAGDDLYAGGIFTTAGRAPANGIARWNGSIWSSLGSGLSGSVDLPPSVTALVAGGKDLYVGGNFPTAGGIRVNNIARWNGSSWSALGSGIINGWITAMAVSGGDLYVAGRFDQAGGLAATNIAKWDGTGWSPVGHEFGDRVGVSGLAVHGTDLYVGITSWNGDTPEPAIMKWDGVEWTTVGSGTDGSVMAMTFVGDQLYVGGSFTSAGGKVSANLARYLLDGVPAVEVFGSRATAFFRGIPAGGYQVDRTTDFIHWENLATRYAGETGGIDFTDGAASRPRAFYRAVPLESSTEPNPIP